MHRNGYSRFFICLLLAFIILTSMAQAQETKDGSWRGRIMDVIDGDSLVVSRMGYPIQIRMYGIDAPERGQPGADQAKEWLEAYEDSRVLVKPITYDRYNRTVSMIFLDDKCLNHEIIKAGWAWWYRKYAPDDKNLATLEQSARSRRIGLWSDPDPKPPRAGRKQE